MHKGNVAHLTSELELERQLRLEETRKLERAQNEIKEMFELVENVNQQKRDALREREEVASQLKAKEEHCADLIH